MTRLSVLALLALLPLTAQADTKKSDPSAAAEVQDVVFYGSTRPVLMRLHIWVNGKPFTQGWDTLMERWFKYADLDGDGKLDADEIKFLPTTAELQQHQRGQVYAYYRQVLVKMEDIDLDEDKKVTLEEMRRYYARSQLSAIQIQPNYGGYYGQFQPTELILRLLDKDQDGKLSKEELAGAEALINRLDTNDDETIDVTELAAAVQPRLNPRGGRVQVQQGGGMMAPPRQPAGNQQFFLVPREQKAGKLTERLNFSHELIKRYDKDQSGKLSRAEIGFSQELFQKLDANKDGALDAVELLRYLVVTPDVEMTIRLGDDRDGVELVKHRTLKDQTRLVSTDAVRVNLDDAILEVRRTQSYVNRGILATKEQVAAYFRTFDQGNKGFADLKELRKSPQYRYMVTALELADRDRDQKVTLKEYTDLVQLQATAMTTVVSVSAGTRDRGLFEALDVNRDGRLSVRELRHAWSRIAAWDKNKDGKISDEEIPHQYHFVLASGAYGYYQQYQPNQPTQMVSTVGPVWFRKMDRNGDGDISRREFLGSPEDFDRLDEDKDGYISLEEAMKAEEKLRRKTSRQ